MRTPVMEIFGLEAPIFAFSHCRDVVAAVSRCGGMGTLGTSHFTTEQLELELKWLDQHCDAKPYGVDVQFPSKQPEEFEDLTPETVKQHLPQEHREFVTALLKKYNVPELSKERSEEMMREYMSELTRTHREAEKRLEAVYRHPLARMIVSALGPPPASVIERAHSLGLKVAALIGHPKHAKNQARAGVDIIIAQGWEAAGHTGEISTMVLVPEVVDLVAPIPVLAAGGIGCGRQMTAALALGAQGVWTGTVWLGTVESEVMPELKKKLFAATSSDTLRSRCGTGKPARRLRSAWVEAWEAETAPKALRMPLQSMLVNEALERITRFKADELLSYPAGQVVGQLHEETSVKQVVFDMLSQFSDTLDRLNHTVQS
jgi:NAD(P)H-dependent flavin oxidoreductase YrpB (nitropropane dioxygenase family)